MKALILAAGRGKRINSITQHINKCMVPVNGLPLLQHHLEQAAALHVSAIVVVVGYLGDTIAEHFGASFRGIPVHYVMQPQQLGLVHAMECAVDHLDEDFILMLGDEYFIEPRHGEMVELFQRSGAFAVCGVVEEHDVDSIRKTYAVIEDEEHRIHRLIEKPRKPFTAIKGTGCCLFRREIMAYVQYTAIHYLRQERELPGLIQEAVDDGEVVYSCLCCSGYLNVNRDEDIAEFTDAYRLAIG